MEKGEIGLVIDSIRGSFDKIKEELKRIRENNDGIIKENHILKARLDRLEDTIISPLKEQKSDNNDKKRDSLQEEMLSSLKRRRRQIIKGKILSILKSGAMSIPELKHMIVDELSYCSKATFYRYLNEITPFVEEIIINGDKRLVSNQGQKEQ